MRQGKNKRYIHHPLQSGQCSNHDDSDRKTVPETNKTDVLVDSTHSGTECFTRLTIGVQFANHDIGGMRDYSAENTGKITTSEGNTGLSTFTVVGFLSWEVVVDCFDDRFEGGEFHHGVRDLSTPERVESLVETNTCLENFIHQRTALEFLPSCSLLGSDSGDTVERAGRKWWNRCLHADFDSFEGT